MPWELGSHETLQGPIYPFREAVLTPKSQSRAQSIYTTNPAISANYGNCLVGVQSVVIDPLDRLWILDTGCAAMPNGTNAYSSVDGGKLIGVNLSNNTIFKIIIFPPNVAYPDCYNNDICFDLRSNVTASG